MTSTATFYYTGSLQEFIVPQGVTSLEFFLIGGEGGGYIAGGSPGTPGQYGGTMPVTPGDVLGIHVAQLGGFQQYQTPGVPYVPPYNPLGWAGGNTYGPSGGAGGYSTGATNNYSGCNGGGATAIYCPSTGLTVVAGGGGGQGAGNYSDSTNEHGGGPGNGGFGGTSAAGSGADAGTRPPSGPYIPYGSGFGIGGGGATSTAVGLGGQGNETGTGNVAQGQNGSGPLGGNGGSSNLGYTEGYGGGGGGAGIRGGGGGGGITTNTPLDCCSGGGGGANGYIPGSGGEVPTVTLNSTTQNISAQVTITYTAAPAAPSVVAPPNNSQFDQTSPTVTAWIFNPVDPSDYANSQSKADMRWRINSGAWTQINGYSCSYVGNQYQHVDAANVWAAYTNQTIEFQIRSYGFSGSISPWSYSTFITPTVLPPAPTVRPTIVIQSTTPTLAWGTQIPMVSYEYQIYNDASGFPGDLLFDSGPISVPGLPTSYTITMSPYGYSDGVLYHIGVRYLAQNGIWSAYTISGPTVASLLHPLEPTAVVTPLSPLGSIQVEITNPGSDPHPPAYNDVYRTDLSRNGVEIRVATLVPVNGTWTDTKAAWNTTYRYRINAVTATGAGTSSE